MLKRIMEKSCLERMEEALSREHRLLKMQLIQFLCRQLLLLLLFYRIHFFTAQMTPSQQAVKLTENLLDCDGL